MNNNTINITPKEIVANLDKYIIGQQEAKKTVAIALRNRWRRMNTSEEMRKEISPNNILMIGSTGIGKTEIARRLAKISNAPFVKVEASKFTEVGYVGRDVESMVRDLAEQAVKMVKADKKEELKDKAMENVEDVILDALIPPVSKPAASFSIPSPNSDTPSEEEQHQKTREWFREKLKKGDLEDRKIEIDVQQNNNSVGVVGPQGIDDASMANIQEMINGMLPKKTRKRKIEIKEARKILLDEEVSKMIDMDDLKDEAIQKVENTGIIFIDEVDKIAKGSDTNKGGDVSREGVQRDLLPIVEGSAVNTKYGIVNTDHILFIAAGAFHFAKPSDLIPELQGRFPIRAELNPLSKSDFIQILKEPKNALTKQYQSMFEAEGVTLEYSDTAIEKIAEYAFNINEEIENIGARRLQTVMTQILNDFLFDMPDSLTSGSSVTITPELVDSKLSNVVQNKDLSKYIL